MAAMDRERYWSDPVYRQTKIDAAKRDYERNREARLAARKAWAERNHDKVLRSASERYYQTDPRKRFAQRANRKVAQYGRPDDTLDWTTIPDGPWTCTYCGVPCESWDHVDPMTLGGANKATNLVPSCLPCNQRRMKRRPKPRPSSCPSGHQYDLDNTYLRPNGSQVCRTCGRERYHRRLDAEAA